jgi:hypothetical protein
LCFTKSWIHQQRMQQEKKFIFEANWKKLSSLEDLYRFSIIDEVRMRSFNRIIFEATKSFFQTPNNDHLDTTRRSFTAEIVHRRDRSHPRSFSSKIVHSQDRSRPRSFSSEIVRIRDHSHPRSFSSEIVLIQDRSHPRLFSSEIVLIWDRSQLR